MMTDRRNSIVERRGSQVSSYSSRRPSIIPELQGIEKPNIDKLPDNLECDVLIVGTGLVESILAAALSWQGSRILHIDANNYYGDNVANLTIEQIKNWFINSKLNRTGFRCYKNVKLEINDTDFKIISKDYGIDLSPKILFTKSPMLDLLLKSRVYNYLEFQSLSDFHTFEDDSFGRLVSSKEDIFTSETLTLVDKRKLMKFLKFITSEDSDSFQISNDMNLKEYLTTAFKLEEKYANELMFTLGLINNPGIGALDGLYYIRRYLLSLNIYGNFPTLYSKYGGPGEISQAFCRSAAVAGTIYKLGTSLDSYNPKSQVAHLTDGSTFKVNEKIVSSLNQSYSKPIDCKFHEISRMILVVDKGCELWINDNESSSIVVFPPNSLNSNNKYPVEVLIMGTGTGCCPPGQCIWYMHTIEPLNGEKDLEAALAKMEESYIKEHNFNYDEFEEGDFANDGNRLNESGIGKLSQSLNKLSSKIGKKDEINYVMKLQFTQLTNINQSLKFGYDDIVHKTTDGVIIPAMPSGEMSYDGTIEEAKKIYKEIVGDDVDFFDIDFEDDEDDEDEGGYDEDNKRDGEVVAKEKGTEVQQKVTGEPKDASQQDLVGDMEFEL